MSLCTSYFNLQLYSRLLITYGRLLKKVMKPLQAKRPVTVLGGYASWDLVILE